MEDKKRASGMARSSRVIQIENLTAKLKLLMIAQRDDKYFKKNEQFHLLTRRTRSSTTILTLSLSQLPTIRLLCRQFLLSFFFFFSSNQAFAFISSTSTHYQEKAQPDTYYNSKKNHEMTKTCLYRQHRLPLLSNRLEQKQGVGKRQPCGNL